MADIKKYNLVGRYMTGSSVAGYEIQDKATGQNLTRSRGQVCLLVGAGRIENCDARIDKDRVILIGVGINIDELPVCRLKKDKNTANVIESVKDTHSNGSKEDIPDFKKYDITKRFEKKSETGRYKTVGYGLRNINGNEIPAKVSDVYKLCKTGMVRNATAQLLHGEILLRGVDCKLRDLPVIRMN